MTGLTSSELKSFSPPTILSSVVSTLETRFKVALATVRVSSTVRLALELAVFVPSLMSERRVVDWIRIGMSLRGSPSARKLVMEEFRAVVALEMVDSALSMDAPSARTLVLRAARGRRIVEKRMVRGIYKSSIFDWGQIASTAAAIQTDLWTDESGRSAWGSRSISPHPQDTDPSIYIPSPRKTPSPHSTVVPPSISYHKAWPCARSAQFPILLSSLCHPHGHHGLGRASNLRKKHVQPTNPASLRSLAPCQKQWLIRGKAVGGPALFPGRIALAAGTVLLPLANWPVPGGIRTCRRKAGKLTLH